MNKYKIYISLIIFVININLLASKSKTINVAVLTLDNNGLYQNEVELLTQRLQSEFVKTGSYRVVERAKIDKMFQEQAFQNQGYTEEVLIQIGKILGAQQIIIGSAGKFNNIYTLSARLIDAQSGLNIKSADFDIQGDINALLKQGVKQIAIQLSGKKSLWRRYKRDLEATRKEDERLLNQIERESRQWDISFGISTGIASYLDDKYFKNTNPNGFYFTSMPNSSIFNLGIRRGSGFNYSSFSLIIGSINAEFDKEKVDNTIIIKDEILESRDYDLYIYGLGGQINLFKLLFLESNMIFIDPIGIGVHGFAGISFEGILSSILGRSMNLKIGPEIFYTNQVSGSASYYSDYNDVKVGPTMWSTITCRLEILLNIF